MPRFHELLTLVYIRRQNSCRSKMPPSYPCRRLKDFYILVTQHKLEARTMCIMNHNYNTNNNSNNNDNSDNSNNNTNNNDDDDINIDNNIYIL